MKVDNRAAKQHIEDVLEEKTSRPRAISGVDHAQAARMVARKEAEIAAQRAAANKESQSISRRIFSVNKKGK